jgi:DNA-binding CsgD family transcriptional regulator
MTLGLPLGFVRGGRLGPRVHGKMSTVPATFIDREAELAELGRLVEDARRGSGRVIVIEGEAGIGKTSLAAFAAEQATMAGLRVLKARGSDLEQGFAFGVVRQLLERVASDDPDLLNGRAALAAPVLGGGTDAGVASASEGSLHGLYWLVAALSEPAPVMIVIDDLQWADQESVSFLRFLAVRVSGLRLALLLATRPLGAGTPAATVLADPAVEIVKPGPLSVEGASRLLRERLASYPAPEFTAACHAQTGGNPFLLGQLAQAVIGEGIEAGRAQASLVGQLRVDGIARTLLARVSPGELAVAKAIAILGDDVPVGHAADLAGVDGQAAEQAADSLAAGGILQSGRPLRFRHALLRSAVLSEMPAGERARAHAAAVALLRAGGASAEHVAAHLLALEPTRVAADAATLIQAARDAAGRSGPASAATLLERALQEPLEPDQRVGALMLLGAAEDDLGRAEAAERFIDAARLATSESLQAEAAIAAAEAAALDSARAERAIALLDALPQQDPESEVGLRVLNARLAATYSDRERFAAVVANAEVPEQLTGSTSHESVLLTHLARARLTGGANAAEVADLARRATHTPVVEDPGWFIMIVIALTATDQLDTAERVAQLAVERARERGALRTYVFAMAWRARIALFKGQLTKAEELADAALQAGNAAGEWWRLVPMSVLLETLVDQGRIADASGAWAWMDLGETVPPHRPLTPLLQARARLRIATGEHEKALADLAEATRRLGGSAAGINGVSELLHSAEAHWALEDRQAACDAASSAVEITRRFGAASSLGAALRIQSRLTDDEHLARESVSLLEQSPRRLELARALIDLGALLRRHGDRRESREPLRKGHELAASCGARGLATHAQDELAASGGHIARRDPTRRDQLTPSEHRIATMAADGNTNREIAQSLFLTVKTVEMHLSNAYRKLGVRSRHDLPEALAVSPLTSAYADTNVEPQC